MTIKENIFVPYIIIRKLSIIIIGSVREYYLLSVHYDVTIKINLFNFFYFLSLIKLIDIIIIII